MWKQNKPRTVCLTDEVFCIAYGSNLDGERMRSRCPGAEEYGTSAICTGFYATIEQDANCCVPVAIYRMTVSDELRLDRFEGFPKYYYKRDFLLPVWGLDGRKMTKRKNCIVYIMHEYRELGEPTEDYFHLLDCGYEYWGFEKSHLYKALADSIGTDAAKQWIEDYCCSEVFDYE